MKRKNKKKTLVACESWPAADDGSISVGGSGGGVGNTGAVP